MTKSQRVSLFLLRFAMGWMMFYAGITKILNPKWSALGYINNASTFPEFYKLLVSPQTLPVINFLNEWGLLLIGISLMLGVFVRLSSVFAALLMLLYYFPILKFPIVGEHSYIIDDHIIYALVFLFFAAVKAGRIFGLEGKLVRTPGWLG